MFMSIFWVVLASVALIAELLTGTFYLLVLGVAAGAACAVAFLSDVPPALQFVLFTVLSVPTIFWLHSWRKVHPAPTVMAADVGAVVEVLFVRDDGRYRVRYSGTEWDAEVIEGAVVGETPRWLTIIGTKGNLLKCKPAPGATAQ